MIYAQTAPEPVTPPMPPSLPPSPVPPGTDLPGPGGPDIQMPPIQEPVPAV